MFWIVFGLCLVKVCDGEVAIEGSYVGAWV